MFSRLPLDLPAAGEQLIAGMSSCKIELQKADDGQAWCSVDIGGTVDADTDRGVALLRTLIEEFRAPKKGGAL